MLPACRKGTDTVTGPARLSVFLKIALKTKKASMYVNDRKLRRISTKMSDRIEIQSSLDRHLVKTSKMRFNGLKKKHLKKNRI